MSVKESGIRTNISEAIRGKYHQHAVVNVNHGSAFSVVGRPDLDGCVFGQSFAFEVKNEQGKLTKIQEFRLLEYTKAGAIVGGVRSPEDALRLLDHGLAHLERPDRRMKGFS